MLRKAALGTLVATSLAGALGLTLGELHETTEGRKVGEEPKGAAPREGAVLAPACARLSAVARVGGTKVQILEGPPSLFGIERSGVDPKRFLAALAVEREPLSRAPKSARLRLSPRSVSKEEPGLYADLYGAILPALDACRRGATEFEVPMREVLPALRSEHVEKIEAGTVVAAYETSFSRRGDQEQRGMNIDAAAAKLDGLILPPHKLVSFNDVVGERSEANGFHRSFEIYKGEMIEGVGGGTCQVATTFHAAAFFAGLDIPERLPHSRPSVYVPMGLDATVVYPIVDLKILNPYDEALVTHTTVDKNRLRVELFGKRKLAKVIFSREIEENLPYVRKIVEKDDATEVIHKQHGIPGYKIKRVRTVRLLGKSAREEILHDSYPATNEIYEVPKSFDAETLPAMNEGEGTPLEPGETPPEPLSADAGAPLFKLGKGAHTPTLAQLHPTRKLTLAP